MGGKDTGAEDAAAETGKQDRLTALQATWADRPEQINPFGSLSWSVEQVPDGRGGMVDKWVQTQSLSDDMQSNLDADMGNVSIMQQMRSEAMKRAQQDMASGPDWAQFGDAQGMEFDPSEIRSRAEDAMYQRQANRLNPRFEQEAQQMEVKLRNRGLREGDEAFDNAMRNFNMSKNDAYEQARLASIGEGRAESDMLFGQQKTSTEMANALRDKKIQEYLAKRNFSLDEANSLDPTGELQNIQSTYGGA